MNNSDRKVAKHDKIVAQIHTHQDGMPGLGIT